jgi:hypothetical protein
MKELRTITTPAGIGDYLWIASKLLNTGEKFNVIMPDSSPQRGHQLTDLMPYLIASHKYQEGLGYRIIDRRNILGSKSRWSHITEKSFYLSANRHLEAGRRIGEFLPDLPPTYKMTFITGEEDKAKAEELLPVGPDYIGIYTSAYKNARHEHYNGWAVPEWSWMIRQLHKERKFVFVIIGAQYDSDLSEMLMDELSGAGIPFVNTVGQPLGVVVELLKRLYYFMGFPSGLSILNEYQHGCDGLMFYGERVKRIINTWADPVRIKNGNIKECLFTDPEKIYEWLKNSYQIFDR